MTIEELQKKVDEVVKQKKDFSLAFTVLDSQLSGAKNLLNEVLGTINGLDAKKKDLENTVKKEKDELIKSIESKEKQLTKMLEDAAAKEAELRGRQYTLEGERNRLIEKEKSLDKLLSDNTARFERFGKLIDEYKDILNTFK